MCSNREHTNRDISTNYTQTHMSNMTHKVALSLILVAAFPLVCTANSQQAQKDKTLKVKEAFNQIEKKYNDGYCESIAKSEAFNPTVMRYIALLAMEDITVFASGGNAATRDWIGSIDTFQISRRTNKTFIDFITYADRKDVQAIVSGDADEFSKAAKEETKLNKDAFSELQKEIEVIKKSGLMPMATRTKAEANIEAEKLFSHPVYCRIYQIVMDENSAAAIEFQGYSNSVHQRATHRNVEKFEQSLKDLESYN